MKGELRTVSFRCRGHPDLRATHHKSVEFTRDVDVTGRATCVLGVAAEIGPGALAGFRGPVSLSIEAGGCTGEIRAVANPGFDPTGRLVIRTSRHHSPDTFALAADKGADRLDRQLAAELTDPHNVVTVTVTEEPAPARGTPRHRPIASEVGGAESDSLARQLEVLRECGSPAGQYVLAGLPGHGIVALESALRTARRTGTAVVWHVDPGELAQALTLAAGALEQETLTVAIEPEAESGLWLRGTAAGVQAQWEALGSPPGAAVLAVPETDDPAPDLSGQDALLIALLTEGVPSRTIATALGRLPGRDYRAVYRHVLKLKAAGAGADDSPGDR